MLFFEYSFIFIFLPCTLLVYHWLPGTWRFGALFFLSCVFYAASSFEFLPILVTSIIVDYVAAGRIHAAKSIKKKRGWLLVSLFTNLGLLATFKYAGFFSQSLRSLGLEQISIIELALPVGISFYTFQSMSYTVDVYRNEIEPTRNFFRFAAFVTMFPQLIAGPIVRYSQINDQFDQVSSSSERFAAGIPMFCAGLAKKILLADTLAILAAPIFEQDPLSAWDAWTGMFLYAGQIYFDFSGYTDMAIGLGRMLGFEFPINFNSPYQATSFSDFWRRWHISLSTWLRDYLYIPLGGSRGGKGRTYFNLMVTMLLGGLWHGAAWTFVIWGAIHGAALATERVLREVYSGPRLPTLVRRVIVFLVVVLAWVPFRSDSFDVTLHWWGKMLTAWTAPCHVTWTAVVGALLFLVIASLPKNTSMWSKPRGIHQLGALVLFCFSLFLAYGRTEISPFLYFRF